MAGKPREKTSTYKKREVSTNSKTDLQFLYLKEGLSSTDISNIFGVSNDTILRRLDRYGIKARDNKGKNNAVWNGGVKYEDDGYVLIWVPEHPYANSQGYVREHRLVMEKHIGRYLESGEVVHHKNKNRKDNRIDNLQLLSSNSEHAKLESVLRLRDEQGRFK